MRSDEPLHLCSVARPGFAEHWVTALPADASPGAADAVLARAAATLAERGIQPVHERLFADADALPHLRDARARALHERGLDADTPFTAIDGGRLDGSGLSGVQIWGVSGVPVATVEVDGTRGRAWTADGSRFLCLCGVRGTPESDGAVAPAHARRMFDRAGAVLGARGFTARHIARTWTYLTHILDWYGEFNGVRSSFYAREKVSVFPASSGTQGRVGDEEIAADVLAIAPADGARVCHIDATTRQRSPAAYGSAFSRATRVQLPGPGVLHVSGTASVDLQGRTRHVGDAEAQSVETLLNLGALLGEQGGGLGSIVSAIAFCKNRDALEALARVRRLLEVPDFPTIPLRADLCRPELLVEIEAVAVVGAESRPR